MSPGMLTFLEIWRIIMWIAVVFFTLSAIGILLFHWIKSASLKSYKEKYNYVSRYEIKRLTYSMGSLAFALGAFVNTAYHETVATNLIWFFVRLFIAVCFATLVLYISSLIIKYTYPTKINKKLRKYRYAPRISSSGNKMKLLSEDEEDVHLEKGMQAEEDVFSVDYDVWVDEQTREVKIEKYPGHLQALKCNSCGFQTMKVVREEIISHPTAQIKGQLIKHYQCSYCKAKRKKTFKIAQIQESDEYYQLPDNIAFKEDTRVESVKLEIRVGGKTKSFTFDNLQQARRFFQETQDEQLLESK